MNQHYLLYQTDCKFFIAPINEEQFAEIEASKEVSVFERQNAHEDTLFSVYLDEEFRFPGHELREIMELWPDDPTIFNEYESNDGISVPYNSLMVIDREYYEESFQGEWEAFLEQLDEVLAQRTFDSLFEKLKPALAAAFLEAMGEVLEPEESSEYRLIRLTAQHPDYTSDAFLEQMRAIARVRSRH